MGARVGRQPHSFHQRATDSEHHARAQLHRCIQDDGSRGWVRGARASQWGRRSPTMSPVPGVHFLAARAELQTTSLAGIRADAHGAMVRRRSLLRLAHLHRHAAGEGQPGERSTRQPGNQMAGYDMRMRSPWRALPLAFYTQWIGEDEAGGLPRMFIGLFGLEAWGSSSLGGWRLRAEYADTACNFTRDQPEFDCAYRNSIYPQGYTYRGRIIGHSMDNDSRMFSLAGLLTRANGDVLQPDLAPGGAESRRRRARNQRRAARGRQCRIALLAGARRRQDQLGVGYDDPALAADSSSGVHGFVIWQQGF